MQRKRYQEKGKKAREKYQNFTEEEKVNDEKKLENDIKILLKKKKEKGISVN